MRILRISKCLLAVALCISVLIEVASPAAAEVLTNGTGSLRLGLPQSWLAGVTEAEFISRNCKGNLLTQGLDAWVTTLPNNASWVSADASMFGAPMGMNLSLYDAGCDFMTTYYLRSSPTLADVRGAHWVVFSAPYGAELRLTWKVCDAGGCPSVK